MSFYCPHCLQGGTLEIIDSIQLSPDHRSDDITLQVVRCGNCSFSGLAVYEESRRGALDSEEWSHTGYRVDEADMARLAERIAACPDQSNSDCVCPSHRSLSQIDPSGRWDGLRNVRMLGEFPMRLVL